MNKTMLIGRLVIEPNLTFAPTTGNAVCKIRIAVPRERKKDESDFFQCVAFGKTAEIIAEHIKKGQQIGITGNTRTGSYEAKDGTKRYTSEVYIESFDFISSKNSGATSSKNNEGNASAFADDMQPVDDGEMPF